LNRLPPLGDDIINNFFDHFELVLVSTADLKRDVYKVRYQVYCEELGYEDKTQFKQPLERDAFDKHAQHLLIRHRRSGLCAGTARCVLPFDEFEHKQPLPSEVFCQTALNQQIITPMGLRRGDYSEVSRIAIRADFRRRITFDQHGYLNHQAYNFTPDELKMFPHIATCLYFALASYFFQREAIQSLIAMMEPRLMKHLSRTGIYFQPAGQTINYHGLRQPFILYKDSLMNNIKPLFRQFFDSVFQQVKQDLRTEAPMALQLA
jgi:N-acyl amino acid synthase of PEP-CTERM/exosortase system